MFNATFVHEQCGCHATITGSQAWGQFQIQLISGDSGERIETVAAEGQPGLWRPLLRHLEITSNTQVILLFN